MEMVFEYIQANVQWAPYLIFGLLLLAGLNLPVSEDGMLFVSAILAAKNPDLLYQLFIGVFLGAYCSDLISYTLGRKLGPKLWKIKFFAKMVSQDKVDQVNNFYKKYGIIVLICGRFIPFGVRNALFLTAGLGRMNFLKFSLSDLFACTISCTSFFALYYHYGETVIEYVKKGNMIIFGLALVGLTVYLVKKKRRKSA